MRFKLICNGAYMIILASGLILPGKTLDVPGMMEAMDLREFMAAEPPGGRRSTLEPYRADLLKLRENGYTLAQMRRYLGLQGVEVSVQAISQFLVRQGEDKTGAGRVARPPSLPAAGSAQDKSMQGGLSAAGPGSHQGTDDGQGGARLSARAKRERKGDYYVDNPTNPLIAPGDKT